MTGKIQTDECKSRYTDRNLDVEYRMIGSELAITIQKQDLNIKRNDFVKASIQYATAVRKTKLHGRKY